MGPGERCELPELVPGQTSGRKCILANFRGQRTIFWTYMLKYLEEGEDRGLGAIVPCLNVEPRLR